jgi:hypothetical protein
VTKVRGICQSAVQTFCTFSRRPETGRSRRRLGACPSLSWRTRRPRRQPVGWRADVDRAAATTGPWVVEVGVSGRLPTGAAWATGPETAPVGGRVAAVERRGWRRAVCRAAPPSSRALRVASDGHNPAALDLGASAALRQVTWAGRWPAHKGCAPPTPTPTRCLTRGVKKDLTSPARSQEV